MSRRLSSDKEFLISPFGPASGSIPELPHVEKVRGTLTVRNNRITQAGELNLGGFKSAESRTLRQTSGRTDLKLGLNEAAGVFVCGYGRSMAPWMLTPTDNWTYVITMEAFRARGLDTPNVRMRTLSVHIRTSLLASNEFITVPLSVVHHYGEALSLKVLPVDIPIRPWPVAIVTLKHRTLSPVAEQFIARTRELVRPFATRTSTAKMPSPTAR